MDKFFKYWNQQPLTIIMLAAILFRLIAVIFAKGYGMSDDHFLIIETSQSWVDGFDYNNWLPSITEGLTKASGHSLLYPGLHFILFYLLKQIGITDPETKMYIVRFIH